MSAPGPRTFNQVLAAAVADLQNVGFDSERRVAYWVTALRRAAEAALAPEVSVVDSLRRGLVMIYRRLVDRGAIVQQHPGIGRFTLQRLAPRLRAELEQRILASAQLIRLNRTRAIEDTLQRFAGWATSVPLGGTERPIRAEAKTEISKPLKQLTYREQRVLIDQGHKLTSSISEVIARDGSAIAAVWNSHWRQTGYDYREDHKERDKAVYLLRNSWAVEKGYVKPGRAGYYDDVTHAGEEVNCRCWITWVYSLRNLPDDMLTAHGRAALEGARKAARA